MNCTFLTNPIVSVAIDPYQIKYLKKRYEIIKNHSYHTHFTDSIGRVPIRYALMYADHPSIHEKMDQLIQRGVEHGFLRFYKQLESFGGKLTHGSPQEDQNFQSAAIKMDNVWIYIYIFTASNCFAVFIFLCEIVTFHREKIWRPVTRAFKAFRRVVAVYWQICLANVRKMFVSIRNALKRLC